MRRYVIIVLALAWTLSGCTLGLIEAARQSMESTEKEAKDQRLADLGHAALLSGNYGLAEAYLEAALEINPDNPYVLHNLGVVYYNTNRPDKARELYAKLVAFDPASAATAASQDEPAATSRPTSRSTPTASSRPDSTPRRHPTSRPTSRSTSTT